VTNRSIALTGWSPSVTWSIASDFALNGQEKIAYLKRTFFNQYSRKYIKIIPQLVGHVYSLVPLVMADRRLPGQMPRRHYKPVTWGGPGGEKPPLENFSTTWKNVLDIVQKIWAPLSKLFAPPGVPSWLRAWGITICFSIIAWQSWFRRNRHFAFCVCITY